MIFCENSNSEDLLLKKVVILMIFYWIGAQKDLQFCRQESEKNRPKFWLGNWFQEEGEIPG